MDRIKALPERTAYTVLLALCNDPSILNRAVEFSELLQPPNQTAHYPPQAVHRRKRKSPMVYPEEEDAEEGKQEFRCARCNTMVPMGQERESACMYHEGDIEPDYDGFWEDFEDFDENTDGPIDREEMRRRYPQGFFWDCCGKKLNDQASGCRTGSHIVPSGSSFKRSRVFIDDDPAESHQPSPDPQQMRYNQGQPQRSPENGNVLLDNYDDEDLVELHLPPGAGGYSSIPAEHNVMRSVTEYVEIDEIIDPDSDKHAPNGYPENSEPDKT